jgi:competence protein ComEA
MLKRKVLFPTVAVALVILMHVIVASAGDTGKINVNTASAEELAQLKGVGPKYAAKIVEYREKYGPFKTPEDLMNVPGIGPKIMESNKDLIIVEDLKQN